MLIYPLFQILNSESLDLFYDHPNLSLVGKPIYFYSKFEEIGVPREKIKILGCLDDFNYYLRTSISKSFLLYNSFGIK